MAGVTVTRRLRIEEYPDGHMVAAWSVDRPGSPPGFRGSRRYYRLDVDRADLGTLELEDQLLVLCASVTRAVVGADQSQT